MNRGETDRERERERERGRERGGGGMLSLGLGGWVLRDVGSQWSEVRVAVWPRGL